MARFHALTAAAAKLVEKNLVVYSPITMTHPIDLVLSPAGKTLGSSFWVEFDEAFMAACTAIYVLKLPDWRNSLGVAREIKFFRQRGIRPRYFEPKVFGIDRQNQRFSAAFLSREIHANRVKK